MANNVGNIDPNDRLAINIVYALHLPYLNEAGQVDGGEWFTIGASIGAAGETADIEQTDIPHLDSMTMSQAVTGVTRGFTFTGFFQADDVANHVLSLAGWQNKYNIPTKLMKIFVHKSTVKLDAEGAEVPLTYEAVEYDVNVNPTTPLADARALIGAEFVISVIGDGSHTYAVLDLEAKPKARWQPTGEVRTLVAFGITERQREILGITGGTPPVQARKGKMNTPPGDHCNC